MRMASAHISSAACSAPMECAFLPPCSILRFIPADFSPFLMFFHQLRLLRLFHIFIARRRKQIRRVHACIRCSRCIGIAPLMRRCPRAINFKHWAAVPAITASRERKPDGLKFSSQCSKTETEVFSPQFPPACILARVPRPRSSVPCQQ